MSCWFPLFRYDTKPWLRAVGNRFSPLTPKHGFPSHTYKTKGAPLPSARLTGMCFDLLSIIKTGNSDLVFPVTLIKSLRWHYPNQVMGRRSHLPLSLYTSSPFISLQAKTGDTRRVPPVKIMCMMTSYGGIIRIRLKGRSSITSSQPASQAPLYLFVRVLYIDISFCAIGD